MTKVISKITITNLHVDYFIGFTFTHDETWFQKTTTRTLTSTETRHAHVLDKIQKNIFFGFIDFFTIL
jgi:hypothetical protein